ncbi:hypothetical protein [Pseudonocardia cypriaca]|uniref:8-amino-7-oxononanoate synthase n=1 Tax=Pseudonocardia cypriaca TaxID=882449 RepID=A0A543FSN2_9PSEU|nr:hypothetical protein [Pseudonocardia cypriaca]TQM36849.1 hypothetical protein FB388_4036 [Pseudonocardia cypriaca]
MSFTISGIPKQPVQAGAIVRLEATLTGLTGPELESANTITWNVVGPFSTDREAVEGGWQFDLDTAGRRSGAYTVYAVRAPKGGVIEGGAGDAVPAGTPAGASSMPVAVRTNTPEFEQRIDVAADGTRSNDFNVTVLAAGSVSPEGILPVSLQRTQVAGTPDQVLWTLIRNRTNAISFRRYREFIDGVMCRGLDVRHPAGTGKALNFSGTQAYEVLKQATDTFLMQECGVVDPDAGDACVSPVGFLDPDLMEDELTDAATAGAFLEQEARRYGRPGTPVTVDQLRELREVYYEDLAQENHVTLPYLKIISDRLSDIPLKSPTDVNGNCYGILRSKLTGPLAIELFWSYWHEEGMLAQSLNAILGRFQNRRLRDNGPDPLARFDLDPLRPLNNLFWGWAEDEFHRLTVRRRAFEYDHEYGLTLLGRAVNERRTVDTRSNFIQSFHTLLNLCYGFFKEDDDTTVIADGFPLLNALRETHLILAEGAHNQFGDLPSTARSEMLIMQWLLARPEMREFLGGRVMVPYEEPWMDRVDTMKQIQGWTDVSVTHFRDMGVFGEQLVLSMRYGNWSVVNDPQQAANWARYWRPEIQRYTHAYRAATGVDLNQEVDATSPAHLLRRRLRSRRPARR